MQYSVDEHEWSARVAERLRMVQSSCADAPADQRRSHLREELQHALGKLANLPAEDQRVYLDAVLRRFPSWTESRPPVASPSPGPGPGPDQRAPTPREMAAALAQSVPQLSDQEREEIASMLRQAGFDVASESGGATGGGESHFSAETLACLALPENGQEDFALQRLIADLQRHFEIPASQAINLVRGVKLLSRLIKAFELLDKVAWTAWSEMTRGQGAIRRERGWKSDFRRMAAGYLVGAPEPNSSEMGIFLEKTRWLLAGFINGIGEGGKHFSADLHGRFHPDQILDYVRQETEKGRWFGKNEEARCWEKYRELMREKTESLLEEELHDAIADSILNTFRSLQKNPEGH